MFGRIFGRGKDDQDRAVCAECGRTLLAGEWTQTVIDERGDERLICSLCGQAYAGQAEPVAAAPAPANNGRLRETRSESRFDQPIEHEAEAAPAAIPPVIPAQGSEPERDIRAESDAFWQALKDKDAQIEQIKAELARAEAERQELAGRFARLSAPADAAGAPPEPGSLTGDSSEPGERTWGETPAEFAAEMASLRAAEAPAQPGQTPDEPASEPIVTEPARATDAGPTPLIEPEAAEQPAMEAGVEQADAAVEQTEAGHTGAADQPAGVFEDTQPIDVVPEELPAAAEDEDASTGEITAADAVAAVAASGGALPGEIPESEAASGPANEAAASAAEVEAAAASLTLLQRGVDLLNVSKVPRKIAETNEQLGLPHVHAGFDGEVVAITFMWTMGWYRFAVNLDNGDVSMDDRGYEELTLQPNAGVRADGTVQLAPAQISRAAAQRVSMQPEAVAEQPAAAPAPEPETPREAAQKPPEFLSKSLLGQRSDDEAASWEQTKARDFDWDR